MKKVTPFLWFDANAEEAAAFYLSLFPESKVLHELRCTEAGPWPTGTLLAMDLEIAGQEVTFLNGGSMNRLTDAFSFVVWCESQAEIDSYWSRLSEGGEESRADGCGIDLG